MKKLGIKEFTKNIDTYADQIEKGEVFEVVKKSRTLFIAKKPDHNTEVSAWAKKYIQDNRQLLEALKDK